MGERVYCRIDSKRRIVIIFNQSLETSPAKRTVMYWHRNLKVPGSSPSKVRSLGVGSKSSFSLRPPGELQSDELAY